MLIEFAPKHGSRPDLSGRFTDDKSTQPKGCDYQKLYLRS